MPELYRTIDLSVHDLPIECKPMGVHRSNIPPNFVGRDWVAEDKEVFQRQNQFIRTMCRNLEKGKWVKVLKWTVNDTTGHTWGREKFWEEDEDLDEDRQDESERLIYAPEDGEYFHEDCLLL